MGRGPPRRHAAPYYYDARPLRRLRSMSWAMFMFGLPLLAFASLLPSFEVVQRARGGPRTSRRNYHEACRALSHAGVARAATKIFKNPTRSAANFQRQTKFFALQRQLAAFGKC